MWSARIDGVDHKIELEHGIWSGRRRLVVDGWEVHDTSRLFDLGGDINFAVAGHQGLLRIVPRSLGYVYAIALDGMWVNGGGLVTPLPQFVRFASYAIVAHGLFLLAVAALSPGDFVFLFLFVGIRAVAASYLALQLVSGTRDGWYASLGYASLTLVLAVGVVAAGVVAGIHLDSSAVPGDLRTPIGLVGDVAFAGAIGGLLLGSTVRNFYLPQSEARAAV
ncbi:MAG: hypothetical protein AUH85_07005 [Chloroflexi bacterium 13_1_40CM_4_68_4]|nr:MAG: hypothetical protein AUH85_07005 [Chloroflexi bacterium 13_1_40CM_4_68_4]